MIKIIKALLPLVISIFFFVVFVQKVDAQCTVYKSGGPSAPEGEECYYDRGGQVAGRSEFSCGNYITRLYTGYGCYWNRYTCDGTTCGGGGGGECQNPNAVGINCPAGTTTLTVTNTSAWWQVWRQKYHKGTVCRST
jgi:hypothetical protein